MCFQELPEELVCLTLPLLRSAPSLWGLQARCALTPCLLYMSPVTRCGSLCIMLHQMMSEAERRQRLLLRASGAADSRKGHQRGDRGLWSDTSTSAFNNRSVDPPAILWFFTGTECTLPMLRYLLKLKIHFLI